MNQFNKFKDFVHGNLSNKNERPVLSSVVIKEEKHVENIKSILTTAEKKLTNSLLSLSSGGGGVGSSVVGSSSVVGGNLHHHHHHNKQSESQQQEKKIKKFPSTSLNKFFNEASEILSSSKNDSVLGRTLLTLSQLQNEFTHHLANHESDVENHCIVEIKKYLNEDLPSIHKTRKQLNKANEELKAARNKYESYLKSTNSNSSSINSANQLNETKIESLKKEVEYAEQKLEQCRDSYEIEIFDFLGKELTISEIFFRYVKLLEVHHERMLEEIKHYIPGLEGVLQNSSQKPVFGVALEEHTRSSGRKISIVIEKCVEYLCPFICEEGLFRISGSMSKVKRMRNAFNAGRLDAINELKNDAAAIVSTLKSYLRELPEPLLTFKFYNKWVEASKENDLNERLKAIWSICSQLPEANRNNLCYLLKFLNELTKHSDLNKMSSQNLAIALGPSLLWAKGDAYDLSMSNHLPTLVEALITYCDYFFPDDSFPELTARLNKYSTQLNNNNNNNGGQINQDNSSDVSDTSPTANHHNRNNQQQFFHNNNNYINNSSNNNKKKQPAPKPPPNSLSPTPSVNHSGAESSPTGSISSGSAANIALQFSQSTASKLRSKIGSFKLKPSSSSGKFTPENVKNIFQSSSSSSASSTTICLDKPEPPPRGESPSPQVYLNTSTTTFSSGPTAPSGSTAIYFRKPANSSTQSLLSQSNRVRPKSVCERPMVAPPSIPPRPSMLSVSKMEQQQQQQYPQQRPQPILTSFMVPNSVQHQPPQQHQPSVIDKYSEFNHIDSEPEENNSNNNSSSRNSNDQMYPSLDHLMDDDDDEDDDDLASNGSIGGSNRSGSDPAAAAATIAAHSNITMSQCSPLPPKRPPRAHSSNSSSNGSSSNLSLNNEIVSSPANNNNNNNNTELSKNQSKGDNGGGGDGEVDDDNCDGDRLIVLDDEDESNCNNNNNNKIISPNKSSPSSSPPPINTKTIKNMTSSDGDDVKQQQDQTININNNNNNQTYL